MVAMAMAMGRSFEWARERANEQLALVVDVGGLYSTLVGLDLLERSID